MQHILREIQIMPRECAADIIIHLIPAFCRLLKFRHYHIVTALSTPERTHQIMDLFPPVDGEHKIRHLPVAELQDFIV